MSRLMNIQRRSVLALAMAPLAARAADDEVRRGRPIIFPRDHGAHRGSGIEWWYVTGWLGSFAEPRYGFQVTFFRSRTGLAAQGRFAANQLLFAHAAVTDVAAGRHQHAQRITRWSGAAGAALGTAANDDIDVRLGPWRLWRDGAGLQALVDAPELSIKLSLQATQPVLLQGDGGYSAKGPRADTQLQPASHYYSEPQLLTRGSAAGSADLTGRAWLDHEWSDALLPLHAVGWDWIGINLQDGSALTAFRLRRADGSALWAGGSFRVPGQAARIFAPDEVMFVPGRSWASAATGARYPVQWQVSTPAGRFEVKALLDAQELDSRNSTGTLYWEGLAELLDGRQQRVGLGYLELTGYGAPLRL